MRGDLFLKDRYGNDVWRKDMRDELDMKFRKHRAYYFPTEELIKQILKEYYGEFKFTVTFKDKLLYISAVCKNNSDLLSCCCGKKLLYKEVILDMLSSLGNLMYSNLRKERG